MRAASSVSECHVQRPPVLLPPPPPPPPSTRPPVCGVDQQFKVTGGATVAQKFKIHLPPPSYGYLWTSNTPLCASLPSRLGPVQFPAQAARPFRTRQQRGVVPLLREVVRVRVPAFALRFLSAQPAIPPTLPVKTSGSPIGHGRLVYALHLHGTIDPLLCN